MFQLQSNRANKENHEKHQIFCMQERNFSISFNKFDQLKLPSQISFPDSKKNWKKGASIFAWNSGPKQKRSSLLSASYPYWAKGGLFFSW